MAIKCRCHERSSYRKQKGHDNLVIGRLAAFENKESPERDERQKDQQDSVECRLHGQSEILQLQPLNNRGSSRRMVALGLKTASHHIDASLE